MIEKISQVDKSVNFITKKEVGYFESRYVRRDSSYFITYLSSQSGCNKGCKFCWLTSTKQTKLLDATKQDFIDQAIPVIKHYINSNESAKILNYNFMARGEVLSNINVINEGTEILWALSSIPKQLGTNISHIRFNMSSIIPKDIIGVPLETIFPVITPTFYYSLYSVNPSFRKKWMPMAADPDDALQYLKSYQAVTGKRIKLHQCFIDGENDSPEDVAEMLQLVLKHKLDVHFNLVRYNPYSEKEGKESCAKVIQDRMRQIANTLNYPNKEVIVHSVPRVGFDVFASCGMFYNDKN